MSLKIVRNDITKMNTEAIVNTANEEPGEAFITPGFNLPAKYIIHVVSPYYIEGNERAESLLRDSYQKALQLAADNNIKSIAFPLISTGSFGCPKEVGMRIAIDEIGTFLLKHEMEVYIVVFDSDSTLLAKKISPDLKAYIDHNYVCEKIETEYRMVHSKVMFPFGGRSKQASDERAEKLSIDAVCMSAPCVQAEEVDEEFYADSELLNRKKAHLLDPFGTYLLYFIEEKGMTNPEVYTRAMFNNKFFYKITKDPVHYHPDKITALRLCVGAKMNIDEATDLLARAGYTFSPCSMTDVIFKYFIEINHYDLIDIDIELENYGEECIIK